MNIKLNQVEVNDYFADDYNVTITDLHGDELILTIPARLVNLVKRTVRAKRLGGHGPTFYVQVASYRFWIGSGSFDSFNWFEKHVKGLKYER